MPPDAPERNADPLARSELRFRAVIDGFADPLLSIDGYHLVRYVNAAVTRVLGYRASDLLARPFGALVHPDERDKLEAQLAEALRSPDTIRMLEHQLRRADGRWEIVETTPSALDDPTGRPHLMLHVRCVTERKRAEHALLRSEARLREAQRIARVASWELDLESEQVIWSEEIFRLIEVDPVSFGASFESYLDAIHPEDLERVNAARAAALRERKPYRVTHRLLTKTGQIKHVEVQCEVDFGADGRPTRSRGTIQDITERQALEAQLAQRQKMETVGQLAAGVAHDFNNLLTVINATADLAAVDLPAGDPMREACEAILEAGTRAAALTQQLLAFGRKQILQPTVLDLDAIVAHVAPMLRRLLGSQIKVVVRTTEGLGRVRADPVQMDQIVLNLSINGRDAMPRGGTLTLQTGNVELDASYTRTHQGVQPGPYVMLAVSDTGTGMDEATRERMFEPFFTTKGPGKGSGLGLATVYGIVKQSGGDIWCYSEPGKGTTLKVYLPRVDLPAGGEGAAEQQPAVHGTETILVVDDDEGLRRVARRILERHGYTVIVAENGEEALGLLGSREGRIDLLLTDVVMPGMSGPQLAEQIQLRYPATRVLYASGYTEDSMIHHGVADESAPFIMKPYTLQTLPRKVREILDSR